MDRVRLAPFAFACLIAALPAAAQQRVIGVLVFDPPAARAGWERLLNPGLQDLGYKDARALAFEYRFAGGDVSRYPALAKDLAARKPALIVAPCGPSQRAIRKVAPAIPIIAMCADEINFHGEVASLARPGGNTTGILILSEESVGKRLQYLREIQPNFSRLAVLYDAHDPIPSIWRALERDSAALGIELQRLPISDPQKLDDAFEAMARERAQALYVFPDNRMIAETGRIADGARKRRMPAIYDFPAGADAGYLLSYGAKPTEFVGKFVPLYIDRILRGAKAGNLPILRPTQFELVVNMKTAREISIAIPKSLLARADRVIE
jgi:putative ABC transport system substrate-binding protein